MTDRRNFLRLALGAACVGVAYRARGQAKAALTEVALRDGLSMIPGAGGNVVVLRGAAGAALVDSGSPERAADLAALVRSRPGGEAVRLLLNTHWHPEHTGGNDIFGAAGTTIVAHENTRLWMSTEYYVDWEDRTYSPRAAAALPTQTFYSTDPQPLALAHGDERIEYGHLREAHTDGDIYVHFRERNVLVAGGVVTAGTYPVIDHATGGWIGGLVDATQRLLDLADADTLIVPATGGVQRRAHLEAQHAMLTTVRERIEASMRKGKSVAEMLAADVTEGFDATWGDHRERFVANAYEGLWWAGRLSDSL